MSFKLIAIRPLPTEHNIFQKNLKTNHFYKFSNIYDFAIENPPNLKITKNKNTSLDLYSEYIKHKNGDIKKLNFNISAIVGKNGSGKSSLIELLYVTFYKISRITNIIKLTKQDSEDSFLYDDNKLASQLELLAKTLRKDEDVIQYVDNIEKELNFQYRNIREIINQKLTIKLDEKVYDKNTENINIEIFYELDNNLLSLQLNGDKCILIIYSSENESITISEKIEIKDENDFKKISKSIFYNLVINYSLYGLNSEESGLWMEKLFHKNDSYQTPIVLNPYRDKGNIDINTENYLVRSRLLAIILAKDVNNKRIAQGKEIERIKLSFVEKKLPDTPIYWKKFSEQFFPKLYTYFFSHPTPNLDEINYSSFLLKTGDIYKKTLEYILKKITNIVERYPTFKKYISIEDKEFINHELENELIKDLFQDRSHISLKVKQALNFYHHQNYLDDQILQNEKVFSIKDLEGKINSYFESKDFVDLIEYIPPSFFKIELYFDQENENNNFSNLSSGEKQKIYSLNSIVYHIRNLLSVNKNHKEDELIIYKNFNIILDEIELYYHPELQRTFIKDLLDYIRKIDFEDRYFDCIPNINIVFITHSPFILSDISKENILFLTLDKSKKAISKQEAKQTFAANTHEMLTSGFFMEHTKGNFALNKIKK
ncbi:hypothetical protein MTQ00_02705 [Chryseobacterium sp. B21-037]|uniref:hypothetical protein n=1 Tax=Chryseobacterium sp. B21-037 TaxID=2926038 RepID=UPI002358C55B|nr:hypothetical protein [Chryseobacterium sp. B21-037]MDC8103439.1 hypothetical protein [Chryseobacterium sp. B21-037]